MLEIEDLTYRVAGRALLENATARIAAGWTVGVVGRNGTGKSTLMRLIQEEGPAGRGAIRLQAGARLGFVAQELPATDQPLIEAVLAADIERAALMEEAETAVDGERIAAIHARLADIDAYTAEARAATVLAGLGFSQSDLGRPTRAFSGGWRMRAALAGVLFSTPDLLLLDEPTNYLDLEGAAWLEGFLRKYPKTALIVSHDRDLLNRSVTHILALADLKLEVHPGGYDNYLAKVAERAQFAQSMKAKQDAERAHLQAFVDRFRAKASKARQAQSRIKRLEKMQEIAVPLEARTTPFHLEDPPALASPLITLDGADLGYDAGRPVLKAVDLRIDADDRIAVIGPNGQGKTTLVKSLAARLSLLGGRRHAAKSLKVGYFSQDQLDELRPEETVLQHVSAAAPDLAPARARALAARIGFGPQKVETKAGQLSGGEKVRLLFGLMAMAKPHLLILDEPTSHLDIDSREALAMALNGFEGAVILITHDVYLAEATADRLWLVHHGRARPYDGDLTSYRALLTQADRPSAAGSPAAVVGKTAQPKPASPSTLKRRLEEAEARLEGAGAKLAEIDRALAAPDLFTREPGRAERLTRERQSAAAALEAAEEAWLAAAEAAGSAPAQG
jgi:ATP-binding cassette subfamily F protein 3